MNRNDPDRAAEIEITEEMIEAGVSEFLDYDSRFDFPEYVVKRIFIKMYDKLQSRSKSLSSDCGNFREISEADK